MINEKWKETAGDFLEVRKDTLEAKMVRRPWVFLCGALVVGIIIGAILATLA